MTSVYQSCILLPCCNVYFLFFFLWNITHAHFIQKRSYTIFISCVSDHVGFQFLFYFVLMFLKECVWFKFWNMEYNVVIFPVHFHHQLCVLHFFFFFLGQFFSWFLVLPSVKKLDTQLCFNSVSRLFLCQLVLSLLLPSFCFLWIIFLSWFYVFNCFEFLAQESWTFFFFFYYMYFVVKISVSLGLMLPIWLTYDSTFFLILQLETGWSWIRKIFVFHQSCRVLHYFLLILPLLH